MHCFTEHSTEVAASPEVVWQRAISIEGIRDEMWPWLRMTVPRGLDAEQFTERFAAGDVAPPTALGRSWILLFHVLPVEWDDIRIVELEPGRRYLERSSMATLSSWQHERVVEPVGDGTRVTDRVAWETRRLVPEVLARSIVSALFRHRHARLAKYYGKRH